MPVSGVNGASGVDAKIAGFVTPSQFICKSSGIRNSPLTLALSDNYFRMCNLKHLTQISKAHFRWAKRFDVDIVINQEALQADRAHSNQMPAVRAEEEIQKKGSVLWIL